jgi:hypothetical protein
MEGLNIDAMGHYVPGDESLVLEYQLRTENPTSSLL